MPPKKHLMKSFSSFVQKKKKYHKLGESQDALLNGEYEENGFTEDESNNNDVEDVHENETESFERQLLEIQQRQKEREEEDARLAAINKRETKEKHIVTLGYCLCYAALGLASGSLGPTLKYLARDTDSTLDQVGSLVVGARAIGWILGSVVAGKMYENVRGHRVLWIATGLTAIFMVMIPLIPEFWTLSAVCLLSGAFMSWIEVGVNTLAIWIWKEKVGPYMQILHFAFGAGLGGAPFILGFIAMIFPESIQDQAFYWTLAVLIACTTVLPFKLVSPPIEKDFTEAQAMLAHSSGKPSEGAEEDVTYYPEELKGTNTLKQQKIRFFVIVPMVAAYLFLYGGAETSFGVWIFTYAHEVYGFGIIEASYINSAFWAALTIGRALSVPLATKYSARVILLADMLGCILSMILCIMFEAFLSRVLLWGATIVFGASMASIFATAFTIPAELRLKASSKASSAFIVSSGIGDMVLPILVGYMTGTLGPVALLWITLISFVICLVLYLLVYTYGLSTMEKKLDETELKEISELDDYWE